jgi:hypothetical protein
MFWLAKRRPAAVGSISTPNFPQNHLGYDLPSPESEVESILPRFQNKDPHKKTAGLSSGRFC